MVMMTVLIIVLGTAVSGLFSLIARIPVLRRTAQQSRQFRYGLMAVLGGLMFLAVIVFLAWLLFNINIGVMPDQAVLQSMNYLVEGVVGTLPQ